MKAIKNKKRFDPRYFMNERTEQEAVKEMQIGDGPGITYSADLVVPAPTQKERRITVKVRSQEDQDKALKRLRNGEIPRRALVDDTVAMEEDCGGPEMGSEEAEPAITDLSPDEAFGAGYTSAVEEIMASIQGLLEDPMDMDPAGEEEESALVVAQLPDHAMEIHENSGVVEEPVESALIDALIDLSQEKKDELDSDVRGAIDAIIGYRANRSATPEEIEARRGERDSWLDMRDDNLEES